MQAGSWEKLMIEVRQMRRKGQFLRDLVSVKLKIDQKVSAKKKGVSFLHLTPQITDKPSS